MKDEIDSLLKEASFEFSKDGVITIEEARRLNQLNEVKFEIDDSFTDYARYYTRTLAKPHQITNVDKLMLTVAYTIIKHFSTIEKNINERLTETGMSEVNRLIPLLKQTMNYREEPIDITRQQLQLLNLKPEYGSNWKHRLWRDANNFRRNVMNILESSIMGDKSSRDWVIKTSQQIENETNKTSDKIKRNTVSDIGTMILLTNLMVFRKERVEAYEVITEATACGDCAQHDGEIILADDLVLGGNAPKWHPNCRCIISPVWLDSDTLM